MVTNRIFKSGSKLAGYSADFNKKGFRGIMDYEQLVRYQGGDITNNLCGIREVTTKNEFIQTA